MKRYHMHHHGIPRPAVCHLIAGLLLCLSVAPAVADERAPFLPVPQDATVIALDAVSSSAASTATTLSWSHAVGEGSYRMLVVGVGGESSPDRPVTGVMYGAQALAPVPGGRAVYIGSKANSAELWYLPSPNVGTATVAVTFSGDLGAGGAVGGAMSLFGVDQGPPEAVSIAASDGTVDALYSLSITTLTDRAWIVDVVSHGERLSTDFVAGTNQTERFDLTGPDLRLAGSTREVTPAGVVTDTWECVTPYLSRKAHVMAAFAPLGAPSVIIASPSDGETVSQRNLTITAEASGGAGVTNVEFYADGGLLGSDADAPYTWDWDTVTVGEYVLSAKAYDAAGLWGESPSVTIHVVSNVAPTVSITAPADGMAVATNFTISADATDDLEVVSVQFYDGDTLLGGDTEAPYRYDVLGAALGAHTVAAVAWDGSGLSATSTVSVTVVPQRAKHVFVISIDGMGSEYVKPLLVPGVINELTTFKRIQAEGSGTLNARCDANYAVTLPNHVSMMTGRGVLGEAGHNWTSNTDPAPTDTLALKKGAYVASAFDVAHDNGLQTSIWSGKSKFSLFPQSYGPTTGAADVTGPDNGRDKIDFERITVYMEAGELTDEFTNKMAQTKFDFVFFHYQDPDSAGHGYGWSTNPASQYAAALKRVDTEVGNILRMVENDPVLNGNTAIIVTSDHGGHESTHGDAQNLLDFTIPFYVWGPGVPAGWNLYDLNPASRTEPSASVNPSYSGPQPIRNGDAGNLALSLLGLGPIPISMINPAQDLAVDPYPTPALDIQMQTGDSLVQWMGSNVWYYTVQFATSLAPTISWSDLPGHIDMPGTNGLMAAHDTNDFPRCFYRIRMSR